jgi:basic amino acid/polyamine antiporter, APA family
MAPISVTCPQSAEPRLRQVIGVRTLTLSVVNFIVGAAIFVVPAAVAKELGSTALLGYLIAALLVLVVALCFAEAASRVTATGGPYAYVERAFGPWAGFVMASLQWAANGILSSAAVANALVGTLGSVVPLLGAGLPRVAVLAGVYGLFTWLNVRGAKAGAQAVVILTLLKLAPLLILIVGGLRFVQPHNLIWSATPSIGALGQATLLLVFALTGMEIALTPTGEIKDPSRTVPIAAVLGVGTTALLYAAVHLLAQGVLGPQLEAYQAAPLAEVADRVLGPAGRSLLVVGAAVSMIGYLSGDLLSTPRSLFALSRDGLMPASLGRVHHRYLTPHVAIMSYGVLAFAFAAAGSFTQLALLNAIGVLVIYLGVVLAVFKLRRDRVVVGRTPIILPGGPTIPVVALALIIVLLAVSSVGQLLAAVGFVLLATVVYRLWRRRATARP